jgi:transcriptional regulator of acetoin/glycerol metabolism
VETPNDDAERAKMLKLIQTCKGDQSKMARRLHTNRHDIGRRLKRLGLELEAGRSRAAAGIKGTRPDLAPGELVPGERERLVAALVDCGGYRPAAKRLRISPRTMARKMKAHGITAAELEQRRGRAAG